MEVPSSHAGVVSTIKIKLGDKVSQGADILELTTQGASAEASGSEAPAPEAAPSSGSASLPDSAPSPAQPPAQPEPSAPDAGDDSSQLASTPVSRSSPTAAFADTPVPPRNLPHASPSVRKFARELGVNLGLVTGSGDKHRITHDDVRGFVKQTLSAVTGTAAPAPAGVGGLSVLACTQVDFAKFGPIESKPLSRIKKLSGANLHRTWVIDRKSDG